MSNEITHTPESTLRPSEQDHDARLIELWLHGRSQTTQKTYRAGIERFQTHIACTLRQVTLAELQGYADALDDAGLKPATRRRLLASVKSLFSFGHKLGFLPFDTARPLRVPPMRDDLAERLIDEPLLLRMIELESNPRNAAMIALMYGGGLRVSELVGLRWRDLQARSGGQGQATVFGKGAKTRTVLLSASVFARIIGLRHGADEDCPVFKSRKQGHLDPGHVLRITKRAARRAGITKNVRNHDLRHCHASHSLEKGAAVSLVQTTLGHSSIATTGRYLHVRPGDSSGRYLSI